MKSSLKGDYVMAQLSKEQIFGALDHDLFEIYGQPKWTLGENTCDTYSVYADVLLCPECERSTPDDYLPVIESDPELTVAFGTWFLSRAFRENVKMNQELGRDLTLSISVLGFQADHPEFVDRVIELAALTGMSFNNLQFELSEKQPIGPTGIENLIRLHNELGIRLALDNFGRGFSNIILLRRIPFKIVQLSKEFISNIDNMENEFRIAVAIQQFAQVLDLTVCAKGVETPEQLELAHEIGFKMAQGFLIGRPMPMNELKSFIKTYRLPKVESLTASKQAPVSFKMI